MIPDLLETVYIYLLNIRFKLYGKLFQFHEYLILFNKMFIFVQAHIHTGRRYGALVLSYRCQAVKLRLYMVL